MAPVDVVTWSSVSGGFIDYLEMKYPAPQVFVLFGSIIAMFCSNFTFIYNYTLFFLLIFYYLFNISFN